MAVMMIIELPGVGTDTYDMVMQALDFEKAAKPKGFISHVAGVGPGGLTVVDIWDSAADFGAFQQSRLAPAFQKVGGLPEPKVTVIPVHFQSAAAPAKAKRAAKKKPAAKKKRKK